MLNKEELLRRTNNGLDVFKHYLPGQWKTGRNFLNPLYEDRKASCNVYFDRRGGVYRIKDFGNDEYSGDCFFFVGNLKGLNCNNGADFVEILKTINRDMSLCLDSPDYIPTVPKSTPQKKETIISEPAKTKPYNIIQQKFHASELDFWMLSGITPEILKLYKTVSLREFRSENKDNKPFYFTSSEAEPIFGYMGKRYVKIYRPFSEVRFLYGGTIGENYCFGLEQLPAKGDTLFITGGEKDVMTLAAHGFHAICFNSETSTIPTDIIYKLSFRFKHIVVYTKSQKIKEFQKSRSEHTKLNILSSIDLNKTIKENAENLGYSVSTARKYLKSEGINLSEIKSERNFEMFREVYLTPENNGKSIRKLAELTGISRSQVHRYMIKINNV